MNPLLDGSTLVSGLDGRPINLALDRCIVLSGDDWWDGHNYERSNRNTFVLRSAAGRYFIQRRTRWDGEKDGSLEEVHSEDALALYLAVPEASRRAPFDWAFPGVEVIEDGEPFTDHTDHRGHWDANGSGDWHCSEHREPGCTCIAWEAEA